MRNSPTPRKRAIPRPTGAPDLFEGRFSELLIIFVLALIVLGPEKLPRVVTELGRWMGRARAMARQFREQLEEEVQLEEARKAHTAASASASAEPPVTPAPASPAAAAPAPRAVAASIPHAHPTDATGADPAVRRPAQVPSADERGT
jgi:sec-independent protein translocase protein TatB